MKNFFKVLFGITFLPLLLILLFSAINAVLADIFFVQYQELNTSGIWIPETIITVVLVFAYFYYMDT